MPELPEVETVRRGLTPVLAGARLSRVRINRPDLRFPFPEGFVERLEGATVERVDRRAKYLLLPLSTGETWITHLGMTGRFTLDGAQLGAVQGETAGHAQMGDPGLAGGQGQKQILGPPVHAFDRRPFQPFNEAFRERKAQVRPVDPHPRQARARQHRRQAAPDGFDLGKFRHGALLAGLGT